MEKIKFHIDEPKRRQGVPPALNDGRYSPRIIVSKKVYSRKNARLDRD